jgi:hypothetical protein
MLAANLIVDTCLDANFIKDSSARNCKKRYYYYSANISAYDEVGPLYLSLSPKNGIFNLLPRKRSRYT